jgi:dihydropyrimidine dehydrogenase (NAD+) subunit PreA
MRNAVEDFFEKSFPARWMGAVIGLHPDIVENIAREVAKAVNIPVGVKLSPETGFPHIVGLAKRIRDVGAKFISTVNCAIGIAPPDIYNRGKPLWPFTDGNPFVGATGSWLRLSSYKHVAAIARFAPGIDIAGAGGLVTPEHCVEIMMLGAQQVQLCTGILEQGRSLLRRSHSFLKRFLVEQGYQSVDKIIGLGQQSIKYLEEVDTLAGEVIAITDETKCTNCGVCADNFCVARYMEDGELKVNKENCSGCGYCMIGCPVDAIRLEKIARPPRRDRAGTHE